jgi:hypothetical protein
VTNKAGWIPAAPFFGGTRWRVLHIMGQTPGSITSMGKIA